MSKIQIIYSTIGGNTELVVKKIQELLSPNHIVKLQRVDNASSKSILDYDLTILACPTYGQGQLEAQFQPFLKQLGKEDLSISKFAIIGLGDTKYYAEYLTESAGILQEFLEKKQAQIISKPLRLSGQPIKLLDSLVPKWVEKLEI